MSFRKRYSSRFAFMQTDRCETNRETRQIHIQSDLQCQAQLKLKRFTLALPDPAIRGNFVVIHTLLIKHQIRKESCVVKTREKRVTHTAHMKFLTKLLVGKGGHILEKLLAA
jgi:hypothetical protein